VGVAKKRRREGNQGDEREVSPGFVQQRKAKRNLTLSVASVSQSEKKKRLGQKRKSHQKGVGGDNRSLPAKCIADRRPIMNEREQENIYQKKETPGLF